MKKVFVNVEVSTGLKKRIRAGAKALETSIANFVRSAVLEKLDRIGK